ncbi:hypothetical protein BU16DRAFT_544024 [Lophium mytilinum]|uniref:Uncharacterized protein n=1 Tax=Lophium mytilinum TaxID=390894 RepID=A0A6A6QDT5_9PEZI|nr:hypothetical protein BU16DRAFT_544024 [Lophium mytilinum]
MAWASLLFNFQSHHQIRTLPRTRNCELLSLSPPPYYNPTSKPTPPPQPPAINPTRACRMSPRSDCPQQQSDRSTSAVGRPPSPAETTENHNNSLPDLPQQAMANRSTADDVRGFVALSDDGILSDDGALSDDGILSDDDYFDDDDAADMAFTHERNSELSDRPMVKEFFNKLPNLSTLADPETRSWLGDFPSDIWEDAIPLFTDGDPKEAASTDYQLHPCYTRLKLRKAALQPHPDIFRLCTRSRCIYKKVVLGIGCLFVNIQTNNGRKSKWTGYEMFVDQNLRLLMVFDSGSLKHAMKDWFPFGCRLSLSRPQNTSNKQHNCFKILEEAPFGWAVVSDSLQSIHQVSFDDVNKMVADTFQNTTGVIQADQLEIHYINTIFPDVRPKSASKA